MSRAEGGGLRAEGAWRVEGEIRGWRAVCGGFTVQ